MSTEFPKVELTLKPKAFTFLSFRAELTWPTCWKHDFSIFFSPCSHNLLENRISRGICMQDTFTRAHFVYKIPYRRARAWPSGCIGRVRERAKVSCIQARTRPPSARATIGYIVNNAEFCSRAHCALTDYFSKNPC